MPKTSNAQVLPLQKSTIGRVAIKMMRLFFGVAGKLAPRPTSRLALNLFLTPPRPPRPEWEKRLLATSRRCDLEVGQGRIAMWAWGDLQRPRVLLMHGWGGRGSQLGAFVEPLLAAGFAVVAFDGPGHGDSSGKRSSFPQIEEALHAVAANVGPLAAVIAHSAGAAVAQAALARGLDTEKLIFVAPGVDPFHFTRLFGGVLGLGARVEELMARGIEERFGISLTDYQAMHRAGSQLTPLLVAHDASDNETPFAAAKELAEAWPTARFLATEGLGHRRILREKSVISAVLGFLAPGPAELSELAIAS